jgi:hypothetical protein
MLLVLTIDGKKSRQAVLAVVPPNIYTTIGEK